MQLLFQFNITIINTWLSNHISSFKFSVYFTRKNLLFLFYTSTFTKHSHQFIYSTHLFNKIFILLHFFIIFLLMASLSLTASLSFSPRPNHRHHHPATIKPKPRSLRPKLCDFFISHSHGWLEPKPRWNQNPDQAETQTTSSKNKKVDRSEGWSDPFKSKSTPTKRTNREWMRKEKVD